MPPAGESNAFPLKSVTHTSDLTWKTHAASIGVAVLPASASPVTQSFSETKRKKQRQIKYTFCLLKWFYLFRRKLTNVHGLMRKQQSPAVAWTNAVIRKDFRVTSVFHTAANPAFVETCLACINVKTEQKRRYLIITDGRFKKGKNNLEGHLLMREVESCLRTTVRPLHT